MIAPLGLAGGLVLALCESRARWARAAVGLLAATFGIALGVGVSGGRHFAALPLRATLVLALGAFAYTAAFIVAPLLREGLRAPRRAAVVAASAAVACELANRLFWPRLYPWFHAGLLVLTAMTAPLLGRDLARVLRCHVGFSLERVPPWIRRAIPMLPFLAVVAVAPANARRLSLSDNLRFIFFERAPLLAAGVELAGAIAPPPMLEPSGAVDERRADARLDVDWRDNDILLVTVDALRADHSGAYGYARATTPNLDRLAREGTTFLRAYCPTPHTSYSVTSMMTGKNLRPLLAEGLGIDSDTFAGLLRTYGYRTAAFYPPAVFFIDEKLFAPFRDRKLDFEYARVEFADPHARAVALAAYLETQPKDQTVFAWVHLFEPHEPYVAHPSHPFGDRDVDRYDSEVALADEGVGEMVAAMRARRPKAIVIVTADHGEEFGEHGGRYHGTTVYEEQVRVPLVVVGPGVAAGRRVEAPVQTIDILPSVLAGLDIPRPPRIWGRSLGRWLAAARAPLSSTALGSAAAPPVAAAQVKESPFAFALTDDQAMLAEAEWRLVCARRAGACALFNLDLDPGEARDVSNRERERFARMKASLGHVQGSLGIYETTGASGKGGKRWPDAIRRGLAGDSEAAPEIAALLDDTDVTFRRKAAELLFDLRVKEAAPDLRLALSRDEDDVVRRFCALALARLGERASRLLELLDDPDAAWRRRAALALAENGDARGAAVLVAWWQADPPPFARAREVLGALGQIRAKDATPALLRSLDDVRLRPYVAEALAAIGQPSARGPLAERWAVERYQNARVAIGEALVRLGARQEMVPPLVRFLGAPDPLPGGLDLARRAGVLDQVGGPRADALASLQAHASEGARVKLLVPRGGNGTGLRVMVRARDTDGREGQVRVEVPLQPRGAVTLDFPPHVDGTATEAFASLPLGHALKANVTEVRLVMIASPNLAIEALAVVPLSDELPPPPPEPWESSTGAGGPKAAPSNIAGPAPRAPSD